MNVDETFIIDADIESWEMNLKAISDDYSQLCFVKTHCIWKSLCWSTSLAAWRESIL